MSRKSFRAASGIAAAALFSASLGAQTFDDPAGAQTTPVGDGVYAFNSAGYTLAGPALSCNTFGSDTNDVWLAYLAPATGTVIFTVCPASGVPGGSINPTDSSMAVWDDTGLGGLPGIELDCQDGGGNCGVGESEVALSVTAGTTYYVQLTNWGGSAVISGNLAIGQLILPPAFMADDCSTAPLASEGIYAYNSTGFSVAGPTASCNGGFSDINDCWMAYTPSASGIATFSNCTTSVLAPGGNTVLASDTTIAVWDGTSCPPTTQLGCGDGSPNCFNGQSEVSVSVTVGNTYYVQVGTWGAQGVLAGNVAIALFVAPPSVFTDDCSTSTLVSEGVWSYASSGAVAGPQASCSGGFGPDTNDCWLAYTPSASGLATFSNCTSSTLAPGGSTTITNDTYIAVWDGLSCPPTTQLGCGDGSPNCFNGQSEVTVSVTVGNTYYVQVGAWGNTTGVVGSIAIALLIPPPSVFTDDCSTAPLVSEGVWGYASSGALAGPQATCSGFFGPDTNDCWVAYTPSASGIATFSNCATSTLAPGGSTTITNDTYIAVWDGLTCPPTTQLGCGDGSPNCFNGESETSIAVTVGNTYYVQVGAWGPTAGVVGSIAIALFIPPPPAGPGDDCTVAVPHPTGIPVAYNSAGFTTPGPSASCSGIGTFDSFDFWYVFTAPTTGIAVASNCPGSGIAPGGSGAPNDTYLAAWDGSTCPPTTQLGCADGSPNCGFAESELQFNVIAGQTYYVQVGTWGTSSPNSGAVNIALLLPPPNDECVNALPIGTGTTSGNTIGATTSSPTGSCGAMGSEIWFAFTVPCTGGKVTIDTCGSSYDTAIAVFDACGGNQLGCNDDSGANGNCQFTLQSYLEINGLVSGQVIYIAMGGFAAQTGAWTLNIKCDYAHSWTAPVGAGSIQLENVDGPAGAIAFSAVTLDILHPGLAANVNFPNGWFFGVPMGFAELQAQISWPGGLPFTGLLDASGYLLNFTLPAGSVSGLSGIATVWSVGVALDPATGFSSIGDLTIPTAYPL
jgi:predicted RNA-binding protein with TRAM domain